tara:strand:- start:1851 stop:2597 length:747 start_codon:yes stop_codon:yes gene_type:complete
MTNFNFYKITKTRKLRYLKHIKKNATYIVFLHGFMSDLEGKKPLAFYNFAKENNLGFLALEYSGHGKSSGKFIDGNVSIWSKDANTLIKKVVKKNTFILVGSSMGAWISLNQFKFFRKQISGFLGIGSAPEFLEHLMWKKFSEKMRKEIKEKGIINLKHGDYEYPITYQLILDGRNNKVLNKKINHDLNVVMIHGSKDKSVPVAYSKKILKIFKTNKKKLVIIKNGDHSLSSPRWMKILKRELKLIAS